MSAAAVFLLLLEAGGGPIPVPTDWLSLGEAKAHLRVDGADSDAEVADLIAAARAILSDLYGVEPDARTATFDYNDWRALVLPRWPVRSIVSVTCLAPDGTRTVLDPVGYRLAVQHDQAHIVLTGYGWPSTIGGPGCITVVAEVGFTDRAALPASIRRAGLMLIGHWWRNREAASDKPARYVDWAVDALMAPYRRWRL